MYVQVLSTHTYSSSNGPHHQGVTTVVLPQRQLRNVQAIVDAIHTWSITRLVAVPSLLKVGAAAAVIHIAQ